MRKEVFEWRYRNGMQETNALAPFSLPRKDRETSLSPCPQLVVANLNPFWSSQSLQLGGGTLGQRSSFLE